MRPSSRAQRVQEVGLRQLAVVAGSIVPKKADVLAPAPVLAKTLQPDSPSAMVPAPVVEVLAVPVAGVETAVVAEIPTPAEVAVPATTAVVCADDSLELHQDGPSTADSTAAANPSQPGLCGGPADARPEGAAVTLQDESFVEGTQSTVLEIHEPRPATCAHAADDAGDVPSAAADATTAAVEHEEGPVRDSSPVLGLVDSLSSHSSAGDAAKAGIARLAPAEPCSTAE